MVDQCLICDILMTLVNGHSHDSSSMKKDNLINQADGGRDQNLVQEAVEEVVDEFPFLDEWGSYRDTRIHLDSSTGEIVDYLVEECDEPPEWLFPPLGSHVPNETWKAHGINPNRRR